MKTICKKLTLGLLTGLLLAGCSTPSKPASTPADSQKKTVITIGATTSPHAEILEFSQSLFEEKGYELKIVEFSDYVTPNEALEQGDLDANYFQHLPYLEQFNVDHKTHLISVGQIHYEPLGLYAGRVTDLKEIEQGECVIAVPNDGTNEARALQLLESLGYIKLKADAGLKATPVDIVENPYNIDIKEIDASMVAQVRNDVSFAIVNGNYALDAKITESILTSEKSDSQGAKTYANIIAVREEDKESEKAKVLIEVLTSQQVKDYINQQYQGLVIAAE